ncbi:MAG: DUF6599 family protein [Bacteroidales bacterium]
MKRNILAGFFFFAAASFAVGQDIAFPELEGFKKLMNYPVYTSSDLWNFIDGAADQYLSLGFFDLHVAEYRKGKDVIKIEIYRHSDHTMAFGIYASERSPSSMYMNIGSQGYNTGGAINFFKGNYYVKIRTYSEKPKVIHAEETLASLVSDMLVGETNMPSALSLFPAEGKKLNEETYINESVLGHEFLQKAFKASYLLGNDKFDLYLFRFKTNQEAFKAAEAYLASVKIESDNAESGRYIFTDGYNGTVFLSWKESTMIVISGLAKDQSDIADKYTSEILK